MILRAVKNVLTNLGGVGLGCAAADGVTGWCLLALVVGAAQAGVGTAARVIGGAIVFIALMFLVVWPLLGRVPASGKPSRVPYHQLRSPASSWRFSWLR